jgi:hypothetical protein
MIILFIILFTCGLQAQNKTEFNLKFEGDKWWSFVIDSTYLGIRNPDGSLLKREDGTYRYWKQINGKLQPVIKYKNAGILKRYTVMQ